MEIIEEEFKYCAFCKKERPRFACGHCNLVYYCDKICQIDHYPFHIKNLPETGRMIIPNNEDLIVFTTHYHDAGGGIIPYKHTSVRNFIIRAKENVALFDVSLRTMIDGRKQLLHKYLNQPDPLISFSFFDRDTKDFVYKPRDISGTFINPFVSKETIYDIEKELETVKTAFLNIDDKFVQKRVVNTLVKKIINNDEYLSVLNLFFLHDVNTFTLDKSLNYEISKHFQIIYDLYVESVKKILSKFILRNIKFDPVVFENGIVSSYVPVGTYLYRGFGSDRSGLGLSFSRQHDYFGFDYKTTIVYQTSRATLDYAGNWVKQKSGFSVFMTINDLKVLDLTKTSTVQKVMDLMNKENDQETLDSFTLGWNIRNGKIQRSSGSGATDDVTVNWLCKHGFSGYIGYGFALHDELVLCSPRTDLKLITKKYHADFYHDLKLEHKLQEKVLINDY